MHADCKLQRASQASKVANAWIGKSFWRTLTYDAGASGACYMVPEPALDAMLQLISTAEPWPDVQLGRKPT